MHQLRFTGLLGGLITGLCLCLLTVLQSHAAPHQSRPALRPFTELEASGASASVQDNSLILSFPATDNAAFYRIEIE